MKDVSVGTTTKFLTMQILNPIKIIIPDPISSAGFENNIQKIFDCKNYYINVNQKLTQLQSLLLSRLAVREEVEV